MTNYLLLTSYSLKVISIYCSQYIDSDKYLNFHLCYPFSGKRWVVIALVDRAFRICSQEFLDSELLYLMDVLFSNSYPIKFIDKIKKIDALNATIGLLGFHSAQN